MSVVRGTTHVDQISYTVVLERDGNGNPLYIGIALPGTPTSAALWQIRKLTWDISNFPTSIQYANGSTALSAIWDNRASLSYS